MNIVDGEPNLFTQFIMWLLETIRPKKSKKQEEIEYEVLMELKGFHFEEAKD